MSQATAEQVANASPEAVLSKLQAALTVSVAQRTVERGLADGSLPSIWRAGRRLIRLGDLLAWNEARLARIPKTAADPR